MTSKPTTPRDSYKSRPSWLPSGLWRWPGFLARDDPARSDDFNQAVRQLRVVASPYHLAQALLDQSAEDQANGPDSVAALISEARDISLIT